LIKSTVIGSAVSVLLVFSAISYSKTFVQRQDPKASSQSPQTQASTVENPQPANEDSRGSTPVARTSLSSSAPERAASPSAQTYTATAYSLRGRTASGTPLGRGVIAADPSVLPMGSHVWVEAGSFSGEYVVADTGGAVRGKRIDIWTPNAGEAVHFGRRAVKLTVLTLGGRRVRSNAAGSGPANTSPTATQPAKK
jgi:3D (Asp-Asp-Asp) domain-containing protein